MGEFPWYFPYFLHSCKFNPNINFVILTDNKSIPQNTPSNVRFLNYSLERFKADASKALGFNVAVNRGYKFCDFKPTYGYIFSDLIAGYDFWGHCDIDIIFGDIRAFMMTYLC